MIIEKGKYYRLKDGGKAGPMSRGTWTDGFPWSETTDDVTFWSDDGAPQGYPGKAIIAEWSEPTPQPLPVRSVTRLEIVAGNYGVLRVGNVGASGARVPVTFQMDGDRYYNAIEMRESAAVFISLAEALEQDK